MEAYALFFIGCGAVAVPSVLLLILVAGRQPPPSVNPT